MSENKNTPAFPDPLRGAEQSFSNQDRDALPSGLSKREYFAAKALQGILSTLSPGLYDSNTIATYAHEAVKAADYLLEELSNP